MFNVKKLEERRRKEGGFTLIELLIVIAIIAILASIAIPQYIKYQRKARVSSYAEPLARGCAMDIAAACTENPGQSVNVTDLANCSNAIVNTPGGNATLSPPSGSVSCASDGSISTSATVSATLDGVTDYTAYCYVYPEGIKCEVK